MVSKSLSELEDAELVRRAREGDLQAYNALVLRYQTLVYNIAGRILVDWDLAQDVAQETFLRAYKNIGGFRGGSLRAWLARIATNCAHDMLRNRRRHPSTSIEDLGPSEADYMSLFGSDAQSPESAVIAAELARAIDIAISCLPVDQRAALALVDLNGFDYREAAAALGIRLGTLKSRLGRARARLRQLLREHEELLPPSLRL